MVDLLPHAEPSIREAALDLLIDRGHAPSLADVVAGYSGYDAAMRELIVDRAAMLSAGLRAGVASALPSVRIGAIEIIEHSGAGVLLYLLVEALSSRGDETKDRSSAALHAIATRVAQRQGVSHRTTYDEEARHLADALRDAIHRWRSHRRRDVLEAALWIGDPVDAVLRKRLGDSHSDLAEKTNLLLRRTSDPRLGGAVLRGLACSALRTAAADAITWAKGIDFLSSVFRQGYLLVDTRIERGFRSVRCGVWTEEAMSLLSELPDSDVSGAVRMLTLVGGAQERRYELLSEWIDTDHNGIRRAALWQLVDDPSQDSTSLLMVVASRRGGDTARVASRELRRRGLRDGPRVDAISPAASSAGGGRVRGAFERCWAILRESSVAEWECAADTLMPMVKSMAPLIAAKLSSADPLERLDALRLAARLAVVEEISEPVMRLMHDADAVVRARATSMLTQVPGPVAEKLLRDAVNDPDARVQANAIEALDRLNVRERIDGTAAKLTSPHGRVRANAVKSLLRLDLGAAGATLLDMLEDPSPDHRLSALWVIERLQLGAVLEQIQRLTRSDPDARIRRRASRVCNALSGGENGMDAGRGAVSAQRVASAPVNEMGALP